MGLKNDRWIRQQGANMISPFMPQKCRAIEQYGRSFPAISFGTSSYGYDLTVANEFKVLQGKPGWNMVIDPKEFDHSLLVDLMPIYSHLGMYVELPPNSFTLCRSEAHFTIPKNVLGIILGKSTYARCGLIVNATPLEPGWKGYITIELSNSTPLPLRVYMNEGIGQVLFFEGDEPCEQDYAGSKYDNQEARVVVPKV